MRTRICLLSIVILFITGCPSKRPPSDEVGQKIFEEGFLPGNKTLTAKLAETKISAPDILACASCHYRSGRGSREGSIVVPPIQSKELYRIDLEGSELARKNLHKFDPRLKPRQKRSAYTKESLKRAIRDGINPDGVKLKEAMPRFEMSDSDMDHLLSYLETLSSDYSEGVDDKVIRIATVISDDVTTSQRESMLLPLKTFIDNWNTDPRNQIARAQNGFLHGASMYQAFRKIDLSVWELRGDRSTYAKQLNDYYDEKPVFALVGGISNGPWQPIHEFCEKNRIPAIFPMTDLPVVSDKDYYTLYFSKGSYLEGETAASFLARQKILAGERILQIYENSPQGIALAEGFRKRLQTSGISFIDAPLQKKSGSEPIGELLRQHKPTILLMWVQNQNDLENALAKTVERPKMVFISQTLTENLFSNKLKEFREILYVTYPYSFEKTGSQPYLLVRAWLRSRKIKENNLQLQAKTYFASSMLAAALVGMHNDFHRDTFLEALDMMIDQNYMIPVYPNLTFGRAQRYASKGCYIARFNQDASDTLAPVSNWITY